MTSDNLSWKERCIWLAGISFVILVAAVTIGCVAKDNQIATYLSFASALVSIVLAVVAITYTIVQGLQSHQNVGEMKRLVAEGHSIFERHAVSIEESSKIVADRTQVLLNFMDSGGATGDVEENAEDAVPQPELRLDLSLLSNATLISLDVLGRTWREGIKIDAWQCGKLFYDTGDGINERPGVVFGACILATASMLSGHLRRGDIGNKSGVLEVRRYPEELLGLVKEECNRRIENGNLAGSLADGFKQMPGRIYEVQCD